MRPVTRTLLALPLAAMLAAPAGAQGSGMMGGGSGMMGGDQGGPMGPGMMGGRMGHGPMMGMHGMMGDPSDRIEGRLAFLRAELDITSEQEDEWDAFAEAARASAATMGEMHGKMTSMQDPPSLPERMSMMEDMMTARLEALRAMEEAVGPLYDALNPEQRETADSLMGMM
ncbi:MAG: Spy/CpxP family protein refolding chaperone [Paracoccaceae bacterium]